MQIPRVAGLKGMVFIPTFGILLFTSWLYGVVGPGLSNLQWI